MAMFKHSDGWFLDTQILKLVTRNENETRRDPVNFEYLNRIVREEIAQDRGLVWC